MIKASYLINLWENRGEILKDKQRASEDIPGCECGGAPCGKLPFTIGTMLRCWEECSSFQQASPDGHTCFIYKWAGSMFSGICYVDYLDITDGSIHEKQLYNSINGEHVFQTIAKAAKRYKL